MLIYDDKIELSAVLETPERHDGHRLVILLHGFTSAKDRVHNIQAASAMRELGFATLRFDLYGHGESGGTFRDHTLFKWISNTLAVINSAREHGYDDLYLSGHSQGGLMAMLLAGMMPDDLKALIPLAPAWMIPDAARAGNLAAAEFDPDHIPDELVIWGGKILGGDYARTAQLIHPEDMIAKYHGPVMIIQGSGDALVPMAYAEKAAELYENSELVVIPDDTHGFDLHLDQVTSAVEDFLMELK